MKIDKSVIFNFIKEIPNMSIDTNDTRHRDMYAAIKMNIDKLEVLEHINEKESDNIKYSIVIEHKNKKYTFEFEGMHCTITIGQNMKRSLDAIWFKYHTQEAEKHLAMLDSVGVEYLKAIREDESYDYRAQYLENQIRELMIKTGCVPTDEVQTALAKRYFPSVDSNVAVEPIESSFDLNKEENKTRISRLKEDYEYAFGEGTFGHWLYSGLDEATIVFLENVTANKIEELNNITN